MFQMYFADPGSARYKLSDKAAVWVFTQKPLPQGKAFEDTPSDWSPTIPVAQGGAAALPVAVAQPIGHPNEVVVYDVDGNQMYDP